MAIFYVDILGGTIRRISYDAFGGGDTCPTGQYLAEYYNGQTPGGTPTIEGCETSIDNDWGLSGPGNGVHVDGFSARWIGKHHFEQEGNYTFTARADDGVRVRVDGELVIDGWKDQPATTYTATRPMRAGEHEITVEYYEFWGDAVAQVIWAKNTASMITGPRFAPNSSARDRTPTINATVRDAETDLAKSAIS